MATIQNPIEIELYFVGRRGEDDALERMPFTSHGEALSYVNNFAENEDDVGDFSICKNCGGIIELHDNGAGGLLWSHDFGSTVCHDYPLGSVPGDENTPVAEPERPRVYSATAFIDPSTVEEAA